VAVARQPPFEFERFISQIEQSGAAFVLNARRERLARDGGAVVVTADMPHKVISDSETVRIEPYWLYVPSCDPAGAAHRTESESEADASQALECSWGGLVARVQVQQRPLRR